MYFLPFIHLLVSKPYIRGYEYTNKPSFLNKCDDININDPSKLAKTSNLLKIDDIGIFLLKIFLFYTRLTYIEGTRP